MLNQIHKPTFKISFILSFLLYLYVKLKGINIKKKQIQH